jgi:hypothetical protein
VTAALGRGARRPWPRAAAARLVVAVLTGALAVAGCGIPQDEQPRALGPGEAPFRGFDEEPEASPSPEGDVEVELWYVQGDRLVPVTRPVGGGGPRSVLAALFDGVTEPERAGGLSSALTGVTFRSVDVTDRIAVVTLEGLNEQVQVTAFGQIVVTLDGRPDVDGVRFRAAGTDIQVPRGDGSLTDAPVNRQSYAELLGGENAVVPPVPVTPNDEDAPADEASAEPPG